MSKAAPEAVRGSTDGVHDMGTASTLNASRQIGWPLSSTSPTYGALETAAASARAHVRAILTGWQMTAMTDTAELVVAELMANAVNASRSRTGGLIYINGKMPTIRMCLFSDRLELLVECWDEAFGVPERKEIDAATSESGRGLNMIDILTGGRWGWHLKRGQHGKCVWAIVPPPDRLMTLPPAVWLEPSRQRWYPAS